MERKGKKREKRTRGVEEEGERKEGGEERGERKERTRRTEEGICTYICIYIERV